MMIGARSTTDRRHDDDEPQQEASAAALCRKQVPRAHDFKEARRGQGAGDDHPAEQKRDRPAACAHDIEQVALREDAEDDEGTDAEHRGQKHVYDIERDQKDHGEADRDRDHPLCAKCFHAGSSVLLCVGVEMRSTLARVGSGVRLVEWGCVEEPAVGRKTVQATVEADGASVSEATTVDFA